MVFSYHKFLATHAGVFRSPCINSNPCELEHHIKNGAVKCNINHQSFGMAYKIFRWVWLLSVLWNFFVKCKISHKSHSIIFLRLMKCKTLHFFWFSSSYGKWVCVDRAHLCVRFHLYILDICTCLARRTQLLWHLQRKVALSMTRFVVA